MSDSLAGLSPQSSIKSDEDYAMENEDNCLGKESLFQEYNKVACGGQSLEEISPRQKKLTSSTFLRS